MPELNSSQRRHLMRIAHHLDPQVIVGKQGVTDTLVRSVAESLEAHELIKLKFNEFKDDKQPHVDAIVRRTGAQHVATRGHVVTLYRQHPEPQRRKIELP